MSREGLSTDLNLDLKLKEGAQLSQDEQALLDNLKKVNSSLSGSDDMDTLKEHGIEDVDKDGTITLRDLALSKNATIQSLLSKIDNLDITHGIGKNFEGTVGSSFSLDQQNEMFKVAKNIIQNRIAGGYALTILGANSQDNSSPNQYSEEYIADVTQYLNTIKSTYPKIHDKIQTALKSLFIKDGNDRLRAIRAVQTLRVLISGQIIDDNHADVLEFDLNSLQNQFAGSRIEARKVEKIPGSYGLTNILKDNFLTSNIDFNGQVIIDGLREKTKTMLPKIETEGGGTIDYFNFNNGFVINKNAIGYLIDNNQNFISKDDLQETINNVFTNLVFEQIKGVSFNINQHNVEEFIKNGFLEKRDVQSDNKNETQYSLTLAGLKILLDQKIIRENGDNGQNGQNGQSVSGILRSFDAARASIETQLINKTYDTNLKMNNGQYVIQDDGQIKSPTKVASN